MTHSLTSIKWLLSQVTRGLSWDLIPNILYDSNMTIFFNNVHKKNQNSVLCSAMQVPLYVRTAWAGKKRKQNYPQSLIYNV